MIWTLFIGTMALSLWAMWRVKSVYKRYSQGVVRSGLTGGEVAAQILRRTGIRDVEITHADGMLGDHYDPIHKRLVLSSENYHGRSPAALGVAAHECGHAIQHARAYAPLHWRMAAVGITTYANYVVMLLPMLGLFTGLITPLTGALFMAVAWGIIMLFDSAINLTQETVVYGLLGLFGGISSFLGGIGSIVLGVFLVRRSAKKKRLQLEEYQRQVQEELDRSERIQSAWKSAMNRWNQLYYCGRDDCVFIPGENSSAPLSNMKEYLYK